MELTLTENIMTMKYLIPKLQVETLITNLGIIIKDIKEILGSNENKQS